MKNLLIATLLVLSFSCKKNKDDYYISCTIDGVSRTFNVFPTAHRETDNGFVGISVGGAAGASEDADSWGFWIDNTPTGGEIVARNYSDTDANFDLLSTYSRNGALIDYEAGTEVVDYANTLSVPIANHFSVTITAIDGNSITGTFSGDFFKEGDPEGEIVQIRNGSFHVKFY